MNRSMVPGLQMNTSIPLGIWQASVELPVGISLNVQRAELREEFRQTDSTAFADGSFTSSIMTGQQLRGSISGLVNSGAPGLGTLFNSVPITFTAAGGESITGTFNIYGFQWSLAADELTAFTARVVSTEPYTVTWGPAS